MIRMEGNETKTDWTPVGEPERYATLDLLRGFALFGVLIVNLLYFFRIPLFDHIIRFHSHPGFVNHAVDFFVSEFVEFKAFDIFALTFGIGIAIQVDRARERNVNPEFFLLRRFFILLVVGVCHIVLVSNVDILTLYAVCGLLIITLLRSPAAVLAVGGIAAIYLPSVVPGWQLLPREADWPSFVTNAYRIYGTGGFWAIVSFRWVETGELILPLLLGVLQRTFGLMLIGVAVWRFGVIKDSQRYRPLLLAICFGGGTVGLLNTTEHVLEQSTGTRVQLVPYLNLFGTDILLAFAYAAAIIACGREGRASAIIAPVAAMGRMALTNYLMQSIVFAILFYGYGFRLFGKLDPQTAALIGVSLYACQLWLSIWWLKQYQFGPFEWLWRSLTYGRRQPIRRLPNL